MHFSSLSPNKNANRLIGQCILLIGISVLTLLSLYSMPSSLSPSRQQKTSLCSSTEKIQFEECSQWISSSDGKESGNHDHAGSRGESDSNAEVEAEFELEWDSDATANLAAFHHLLFVLMNDASALVGRGVPFGYRAPFLDIVLPPPIVFV